MTAVSRLISGLRPRSRAARAALAALVLIAAVFVWSLPGPLGFITSQAPPAQPALRLAVLAPSSEDTEPDDRQTLEDLGVTLTGLLAEMKPHLPEGIEIVPATETGALSTVEQARDRHGATRVITLHLVDEASTSRLRLGLDDAENVERLRSASLALVPSAQEVQVASLAAKLAELFDVDLPPSFLQRLHTAQSVDPAALFDFERGRDALERHQPEEVEAAIRFFNMALQPDSTFPEAYVGLAEAHWRRYEQTGDTSALHTAQRFEARAQDFEDSPRPAVYVQRGLLHALRGDYQSAHLDFTFAVRLDSTHAEAHRGLARALAGLGQIERAEVTFQEAIRLNPEDWRGYNALGRFYFRYPNREEPFRKAAEQFGKVVALDSLNGTGYVNLGNALFYQPGRREKSRQAYEHALIMPGLSTIERRVALSNLGTLHYYAGRYEEAARQYESALQVDSTDQKIWGNLAFYYDLLDRTEDARWAARRAAQQVERTLEIRPDDPGLLCDLAEYALILGDRERVHRLIDRVLEQNPRQARILFEIGHLYEKLGKRDRALDLILQSIREGLPPTQIEDDPELAELRRDSRYQQAVGTLTRPSRNDTPIEQ